MSTAPKIPESHLDLMQELQAVVSTIRHSDGRISTNPVGFNWDGEKLRFSTLKQRVKYRNLLANPSITFCVTSSKDPTRYLEIRGRAELADDPGGAWQLAIWQQVTGLEEFGLDEPGSERVIVTIIPEQISAPLLYGGKLAGFAERMKGE